ncbi:hypothetical protein ABBQ38_001097 [Trebouxia sp. C0009 RCD-2024]
MATGRKRKPVEPEVSHKAAGSNIDGSSPGFSQDVEAGAIPLDQADNTLHVNPKRYRELKGGAIKKGPVIYWMSRDQRVKDNWALLYACEVAERSGSNVVVAFNLVTEFLGAGSRQWGFLVRGLRQVEPKLQALNIPFYMMYGKAEDNLPKLCDDLGAGLLICDYVPVRSAQGWRTNTRDQLSIPMHQVDAHNVVPVWDASDKKETAARTIRKKIHTKLPGYLTDYPPIPKQKPWQCRRMPDVIDWDGLIAEVLQRGTDVPEVPWFKPGEDAAYDALTGSDGFLSPARLETYNTMRNDPCSPKAVSTLSAYLHFGHISGQRVALEASKHRKKYKPAVEAFLEEVVVRRELSDNYCHYEPNYDNIRGAAQWAQDSLEKHRTDPREYLYTLEQFEKAETHDELWNAGQLEMTHLGKMHGFMRMYWAKKILEWTESAEQALEIAIYLNDKYEMDGRDPNGYVGCMWSMCGVHDMGWTERPVFGKIRYMNYNGCKRKFKVQKYIDMVKEKVEELQNMNSRSP